MNNQASPERGHAKELVRPSNAKTEMNAIDCKSHAADLGEAGFEENVKCEVCIKEPGHATAVGIHASAEGGPTCEECMPLMGVPTVVIRFEERYIRHSMFATWTFGIKSKLDFEK